MHLENEFAVAAPPERVYSFLLDVNRVVTCMPGAELSEVVDPTTFKGRVRIKVGPITVSYNGTARIAERDEAARVAVLEAEGRETTGPGSARASARMSVEEDGAGSRVRLVTDFTVAWFPNGPNALETDCIKSHLEPAEAPAAEAPPAEGPESETTAGVAPGQDAPATAAPAARPVTAPVQPAQPVNALSLFFSVLADRIRRLFRRRRPDA